MQPHSTGLRGVPPARLRGGARPAGEHAAAPIAGLTAGDVLRGARQLRASVAAGALAALVVDPATAAGLPLGHVPHWTTPPHVGSLTAPHVALSDAHVDGHEPPPPSSPPAWRHGVKGAGELGPPSAGPPAALVVLSAPPSPLLLQPAATIAATTKQPATVSGRRMSELNDPMCAHSARRAPRRSSGEVAIFQAGRG